MRVYNSEKYSYVKIVEIPKSEINKIDMDLCAQPAQTLKSYYDSCEIKPAIICNAGFFAMGTGVTCFNYTDDGVVVNADSSYKEGMGILNGVLTYGEVGTEKFTDFISGYPVLIKDGKAVSSSVGSEINYKARRTVLAYDDTNIYIIAVENPGMNFTTLKSFLLSMKVTHAINLDGGGSTKILQDGKSITSSLYNRAVDNVIAVYLNPKTIYRVQLGAFSSSKNANGLRDKIRALSDTIEVGYKNAYVRKVGSYYKVQVGAFSVKANATKVLNDLKAKGYEAFITTM